MSKTHYRKVFKSDHLGVADLEDFTEEGKELIFTITHVTQEIGVAVAGRKGNYNIAYFKEPIKPLVLNATNSKVMKSFFNGSPFVEDWKNVTVQLYIDPTAKLKGEMVGGVRVHPERPAQAKPELLAGTKAWTNAIAAYKRDGNFNAVEKRMIVSDAAKEEIKAEAANVS